jgi:hypothetical protein
LREYGVGHARLQRSKRKKMNQIKNLLHSILRDSLAQPQLLRTQERNSRQRCKAGFIKTQRFRGFEQRCKFFSKNFDWRVDSWKIDRYTPAHFTGAAASAKRVGD